MGGRTEICWRCHCSPFWVENAIDACLVAKPPALGGGIVAVGTEREACALVPWNAKELTPAVVEWVPAAGAGLGWRLAAHAADDVMYGFACSSID